MNPDEWIRYCELRGVNPYDNAIEMMTVGVRLDDLAGAKEMAVLARTMLKRGYHKIAAKAMKGGDNVIR